MLEAAFRTTQKLVAERKLLSGHDRSDGGLITALVEMCFAGNRGATIDVPVVESADATAALFSEELGLVLEVEARGDISLTFARSALLFFFLPVNSDRLRCPAVP